MSESLKGLLELHPIEASAPCRVDSGGTWDIKAMALPLEGIGPVTINVALNLRTSVVLSPFEEGRVKISSQGFPKSEVFYKDQMPFDSPFGRFFATVSYFGYQGLAINIQSQSPVKSALGGSSTALIPLIKALSKASVMLGKKGLSRREILHLGYHLEDGISGGNCGLQDQAAAVYGGVNQWKWHYGNRSAPFERTSLLDRDGQRQLSNRLLVAYSGKSHVSARTNRRWIKDFLSGATRADWVLANKIVHHLALAIKEKDWGQAAELLRKEMALRRRITPEALIPITAELVDQAESVGCGARFAGAGEGGCLWALGHKEKIKGLKSIWGETLEPVRSARVLDCLVEPDGVK